MVSLDELLHPITLDRFLAEHHGRKPLHIPATDGAHKRALLDWSRFNALLAQTSLWTADTLRMLRDSEPIPPERYCAVAQSLAGPVLRPSPAKIVVLMATGASLIAHDVHPLTPEMTGLAGALGHRFAASVSANVYCSFGGTQALGTHFDPHDVFAVHVEGEKTWRLYENRADNPVDMPEGDPRAWFQATRGALMQEVRMRPGDVLYLPRGWYHDALAGGQGQASLHVTFSVTPLYGRYVFKLLEQAAMQDPAFRAWLPPADQEGGETLRRHLGDLGARLATLAALPAFRDEVAMAQTRLIPRPAAYALPVRQALTTYRRTGLMPPAFSGPVAVAMDWVFAQSVFVLEDLCAQFDFVAEAALRAAVDEAERRGALARL